MRLHLANFVYLESFDGASYRELGLLDEAFEWLNRVFETRSDLWNGFSRGAAWNPLRDNPRWAALKKRAGFK